MTDPAGPALEPVSAAALLLRAKQFDIDAARQLASRADLVDAVGQLIQRLQRERGASGIYLASGGARFARERLAIAEESRQAQAQVRTVFAAHAGAAQGASARSLSLMAWALLGLDAMDGLRGQIERQAMRPDDLVAAFSHLIAGLIELVLLVADAAGVPSVSRLLVAVVHLVQAQEEAGQERAVGALLYASGRSDEARQQRVLHLIEAQERSLSVFAAFAEPALVQCWEAQQLRPGTARLERLRRGLCTARPDALLDSNLSQPWFEACSERIDALWHLQTTLVERLREACAACISDARQDLQDSRGLLRTLRDNPPLRTQAVDRFFDMASTPPPATAAPGEAASLQALVRVQAERLARVEAELAEARSTLHERKVVERAKGLLMARLGLNEEAAFRALQKTSMDHNRRLLDVAEAALAAPDAVLAGLAARAAAPPPKGR